MNAITLYAPASLTLTLELRDAAGDVEDSLGMTEIAAGVYRVSMAGQPAGRYTYRITDGGGVLRGVGEADWNGTVLMRQADVRRWDGGDVPVSASVPQGAAGHLLVRTENDVAVATAPGQAATLAAVGEVKDKTDNLPESPASTDDVNVTVEGASVTVTPLLAVTTNPRFSTRDLPPIAQHSEPAEAWTIIDGNKQPVDLSGKTLRFVAYRIGDAKFAKDPFDTDNVPVALFQYETGAGITVSGASNNVVTVQHSAANTATVGQFYYWLLNVTDKLPLAQGRLPIVPAVWEAT